jgi:uncharacterized protein YndB with AHSA1/START domain
MSKPDLALAAKPSLTLKRRIAAPPAKVYAAWTDPQKITQWFGPAGAEVISAEADARVGGRYRMVFRTPDGEEHDVSGSYRDVVPNEKLTFTWMWRTMPERASQVTITLQADGDGTMLTLFHEQFFDEPARDRHQAGWSGTLEKLARFLEG